MVYQQETSWLSQLYLQLLRIGNNYYILFDKYINVFVFIVHMQILPLEFGQYLEHNICQTLMLCGDNGDHQLFNIISNNDGHSSTNSTAKIGPKWNKFCRINQFQTGKKNSNLLINICFAYFNVHFP